MIKQLLKGRLFGHPIHPMLVHFPTALFATSLLFDVLSLCMNDLRFTFASFYCIAIGLIVGVVAGIFGIIDYLKLVNSSEQISVKASWHGGLQICMLSGFGVLFGIRLQSFPDFIMPGFLEMIISGALIVVMLFGNYLGGDLVVRHGVGVDKH